MSIPLNPKIPGKGILSLAGSGEYLPAMRPVDNWLMSQLGTPARVVCLATAAGTEEQNRLRYWDELGKEHFNALGAASVEALPVVTRGDAEDARLAERIAAANFVYLSGGKPQYLYRTLLETPAWNALMMVLEKGGVVAGCSAGAMIFGQKLAGSPLNWSLNEGFGLLPGVFIIPHFNEIPDFIKGGLPYVSPGLSLVGIEGNTALVCSTDSCRVIGAGSVYLSTTRQTIKYSAEEI